MREPPAGTLISAFWPQARERERFCVSAPSGVQRPRNIDRAPVPVQIACEKGGPESPLPQTLSRVPDASGEGSDPGGTTRSTTWGTKSPGHPVPLLAFRPFWLCAPSSPGWAVCPARGPVPTPPGIHPTPDSLWAQPVCLPPEPRFVPRARHPQKMGAEWTIP